MNRFVLAALLPLAACGNIGNDDGSPGLAAVGSGGTRSYAAADFTAVQLRGPDDVSVSVGSSFSVRAEGDPAVLDKLKIDRDGDILRVGRIRQAGINFNSGKVKVYVTMPRMTAASLAGSGDMTVDRVENATFKASIAGSGDLGIGALVTDAADFSIAGSGTLTAAGTAKALESSIAGSGNVEAAKLSASRADISIAGSGNVRASVDGPAKVSIMGSGDVDLGPKAQCKTTKMGSGSIRCG